MRTGFIPARFFTGFPGKRPGAGLVTAIAIMSASLTACSPEPQTELTDEPVRVEVRLLETTDIHAYVLGFDYFRQQPTDDYGLAYTAALIHQARAENPNHILVDNGDLIQGSALGDWAAEHFYSKDGPDFFRAQVHPVISALNYLNYDVGNLGNHEFNFGLDFLDATVSGANFPYVSANVFYAETEALSGKLSQDQIIQAGAEGWGQPLVNPYVLLERQFVDQSGQSHSVTIGVTGFLPPQIMRWDDSHLRGKVAVRDIVDAATHYVPKMRKAGADIVVVIPHSGLRVYDSYPEFAEQASYQLAGVEGIDAILFGHQHRVFPGDPAYSDLPGIDAERGLVQGVPAVSPGYWGSHLGIIDLVLEQQGDTWTVVGSQSEARPITDAKDDNLQQLIADSHQATLDMINQPLAEIDSTITSYFARAVPTPAESLINTAQQWYGLELQNQGELPADLPVLSAAAPFRAGHQSADDYTRIEAGTVTLANFMDLYVYPNTLQIVEVTGAELKEWLEMSALAFNQISDGSDQEQPLFAAFPSFNFDVIKGVDYTIDVSDPPRYSSSGELANPQAERIKDLRFNGEPVDPQQRFLVVTNNYRAGGGGTFPGLDGSKTVYRSQDEVRQIIAEYAQASVRDGGAGNGTLSNETGSQPEQEGLGTISVEAHDHWRLSYPEGAIVVFESSASELARELAGGKGLSWLRDTEKGYAAYQLK